MTNAPRPIFNRTDDPFADAEALCAIHGIEEPLPLADILPWVEENNYGARGDCDDHTLRRPWGSDLHIRMASMVDHAEAIHEAELTLFTGIEQLVYLDRYGVAGFDSVMGGAALMANIPVRSRSLTPSCGLVSAVLRPIAAFWQTYGGSREPEAFEAFARDVLKDRWVFPEDIFQRALNELLQKSNHLTVIPEQA